MGKVKEGLSQELKEKVRKMISENSTRREIADRLGVDVKKIHNFLNNNKRDKAPKAANVKIQKLEIKEEKEDTKAQAENEKKTMVIITSDINMLKKLIGEL